jgi:hypothetical protein
VHPEILNKKIFLFFLGCLCYLAGTHCASTVGGKTYGVAKRATLIAVKTLGKFGAGNLLNVAKGVEFAVNRHLATPGKKSVASMSLGGGGARPFSFFLLLFFISFEWRAPDSWLPTRPVSYIITQLNSIVTIIHWNSDPGP